MRNILFKVIDYITSFLMGTGTLLLVSLVINDGWNMFLAMAVGMLLGNVVLLLIVVLFSSISTPFEIFPVGMVITMLTGMAAAMAIAAVAADFNSLLLPVTAFSVFTQLMIHLYNNSLKGEVHSGR